MSLSKEFFIQNRISLSEKLPVNTAVFLFAGKEASMCADTEYRFLPDRNFYYLTGVSVPETKVIIRKSENSLETILFVPEKNDMVERWHGKRRTFEEWAEVTGIPVENIRALEEFDDCCYKILHDSDLTVGFDSKSIMQEMKDFAVNLNSARSPEGIIDIADTLIRMRMVKKPCEIEAIRNAAKITEDAVEDMRKVIKPGCTELEIYTELEYHMARRGSLIPAFATIAAVGENCFYLHHSDPEDENGVTGKPGDVVQIDLGARVDGYCADISRAFFITDGKDFTDDDKHLKLYKLVKSLRDYVFGAIKPGESFAGLNKVVRLMCYDFMLANNLTEQAESEEDKIKAGMEIYWHNTGHQLGLDVHDVTIKDSVFEAGNCLAIEPGVYIKKWGIGFRIEDDVLVTKNGCELLSSGKDSLSEIIC